MSRRPRHRVPVAIATLAGAAVVIAIAIAAVIVGPAIWQASTTRLADRDTSVTLTAAGATAEIPVAAGWSYSTPPFDDSRLTVHSLDGAMSVEFMVTADAGAEEAARALGGEVTAFDTEPIGQAEVVHARARDRTAVAGAVVAARTAATGTAYAPAVFDAGAGLGARGGGAVPGGIVYHGPTG